MDPLNHLTELFEYDGWANELWIENVLRREPDSAERSIFQHLLAAQEVWLSRVKGVSLEAMPKPEVRLEVLRELRSGWIDILKDFAEPDPVIAYRRTTGEANRLRFRRIALHVVNHGTYHRGELRGLCRARGETDFPETDLAGYHFHAGLAED